MTQNPAMQTKKGASSLPESSGLKIFRRIAKSSVFLAKIPCITMKVK
jgi:hypothetical protein